MRRILKAKKKYEATVGESKKLKAKKINKNVSPSTQIFAGTYRNA